MLVTFENGGGQTVCIRGRQGFTIHAYEVLKLDLPDEPRLRALLSRLRREYPAIKITEEAPGAEKAPEIPVSTPEPQEKISAEPVRMPKKRGGRRSR